MIRGKVIGVLIAAVAAIGLMAPTVASAESGASGAVAVHNGSFGYQEVLMGKTTTQQIATWGGIYGNLSLIKTALAGNLMETRFTLCGLAELDGVPGATRRCQEPVSGVRPAAVQPV